MRIYGRYNQHITRNIALLNFLISCIWATSVPQMLSVKGECTFPF